MGSDWAWGYLAGKRKARRRYQREMAAMGLASSTVPPVTVDHRAHRRRLHLGRWVLLAVVVLVLCLLAAFAVYAWDYGLAHHLIYHVRR